MKDHLNIDVLSKKLDNIRFKLEQRQNGQNYFAVDYLLNDFNINDFIFNNYELSPNNSPRTRNLKSSNKFKSDDEILFNLNIETFDILNRLVCDILCVKIDKIEKIIYNLAKIL